MGKTKKARRKYDRPSCISFLYNIKGISWVDEYTRLASLTTVEVVRAPPICIYHHCFHWLFSCFNGKYIYFVWINNEISNFFISSISNFTTSQAQPMFPIIDYTELTGSYALNGSISLNMPSSVTAYPNIKQGRTIALFAKQMHSNRTIDSSWK